MVEHALGHLRRAHRRGEHLLAVGHVPGLPTRGNRWRLSHVSPRHSINESAAFGRAKTFRQHQRFAPLPPAIQASEATMVARQFSAGMLRPSEPLCGQMPWWAWRDSFIKPVGREKAPTWSSVFSAIGVAPIGASRSGMTSRRFFAVLFRIRCRRRGRRRSWHGGR